MKLLSVLFHLAYARARSLLAKDAYQNVAAPEWTGRSPLQRAPPMNDSAAHKKRGDLYFGEGKLADAAACYRKSIFCNPDYAEAYNNLGNVCREQGRFEEAEQHLRKAAELKPELANVHYNLASFLLEHGRIEEAIENFSAEVARDPKHFAALSMLLHLKQKICDWRDLDGMAGALRSGLASPVTAPEQVFSPFIFLALPGTTPEEQKHCAQRWTKSDYRGLATQGAKHPFNHSRVANRKLAVGYLSADFHDHATARLMAEVFELHDRDRFQITAYSYGPDDGSKMRERLVCAFDNFVDIRPISDANAARKIHADKIDILVDLKGLTKDARSGILAPRPAPIQVNFLGYPGTMGADFIDYIIADRHIIPNEYKSHYVEQVLYLPHCYQPNDRTRARPPIPARKECGLPEQGFVFCCFNQTYKITPELFDIWCRLLRHCPDSVLWLLSSTPFSEKNLKREAATRGVHASRLILAPPVNQDAHLARLPCADLFLDTVPVNAHTTCSDALWMGLPVLTCSGETFPSRVAGSLLSAMGTPELITHNLENYFQLALGLASDRQRLASIRNKIIVNLGSAPLFDSAQFTRDLENIYLGLTDTHNKKTSSLRT